MISKRRLGNFGKMVWWWIFNVIIYRVKFEKKKKDEYMNGKIIYKCFDKVERNY